MAFTFNLIHSNGEPNTLFSMGTTGGQTMTLEIINHGPAGVQIQPLNSGANAYHFALCFPMGFLTDTRSVRISPKSSAGASWAPQKYASFAPDQSDCYYLRLGGSNPLSIPKNGKIEFEVSGIKILDGMESRNVNIVLRHKNIYEGDQLIPDENPAKINVAVLKTPPVDLSNIDDLQTLSDLIAALSDQTAKLEGKVEDENLQRQITLLTTGLEKTDTFLKEIADTTTPPLMAYIDSGHWNFFEPGKQEQIKIVVAINPHFFTAHDQSATVNVSDASAISITTDSGTIALDNGNAWKSGRTSITDANKVTITINYTPSGTYFGVSHIKIKCTGFTTDMKDKDGQSRTSDSMDFDLLIPVYIGPATFSANSLTIDNKDQIRQGIKILGSAPGLQLGTAGAALGYASGSGEWGNNTAAGDVVLRADADKNVFLAGGHKGAQLMVQGSTGNVGIGTHSPQKKLEIDAGGGYNIGLLVNGRITSKGNGGLWVDADNKKFMGATPNNSIGFWNNDAWRLTVGDNGDVIIGGNVGIGTNSPKQLLDLGDTDGKKLAIYNNQTKDDFYGFGITTSTLEIYAGTDQADEPAMKLDHDGNVDIDRGSLSIGSGLSSEDGAVVLKLNIARPWQFEQVGGSAGASLRLRSTFRGKNFIIDNQDGYVLIKGRRSDGGPKLEVEGGLKISGGNLTVDDGNERNIKTYLTVVDGNVGIGTNKPVKAKLVVKGSVSSHIDGSGTHKYSAWFEHDIAADDFRNSSDARIKQIIGLSDQAKDIQTLLNIEITDYQMKDRARGKTVHKKVIGQQVEEIFPEAVSQIRDAIPDIQETVAVKDGWVLLPDTINVGDRVKLMIEDSSNVYEVKETNNQGFKLDLPNEVTEVFIYGREVDDFRLVDYSALSMLNISATQALIHRVEYLETQLEKIQGRIVSKYKA